MSSDILSSEMVQWQAHLKTSRRVREIILQESQRENRSVAYVVTRVLEAYYGEEKGSIEIVK